MRRIISFADEETTCFHGDDLADVATEQEVQLSRLSRPGMKGGQRIKQILLPGRYAFSSGLAAHFTPVSNSSLDVAYARKAKVRRPRLLRVENIVWEKARELRWAALPENPAQCIRLPVEIADDEKLGYYNCRLLAHSDVITITNRSIIADFIYETDYFHRYVVKNNGGSTLEQHGFAHVDTPLGRSSGYLVLGRLDVPSGALELTAFAVPRCHSVYIPDRTIHTNDFLLGTWETLLASACRFPSTQFQDADSRPLPIKFEL